MNATFIQPGDRFGHSHNRFEVIEVLRHGAFIGLKVVAQATGEPEVMACTRNTLLPDVVREVR